MSRGFTCPPACLIPSVSSDISSDSVLLPRILIWLSCPADKPVSSLLTGQSSTYLQCTKIVPQQSSLYSLQAATLREGPLESGNFVLVLVDTRNACGAHTYMQAKHSET